MGTLFLVATPIGNLQDISSRALETLKLVDCILCEDTRRTGNLLHVLIGDREKRPKLLAFYEQTEVDRIPDVLSILRADLNVALVSDAGTPTISDPGFKLVRECIKDGIRVESIPGPSAVTVALTLSGLPTDKFLFLGFLPKKEGHRVTLLENVKKTQEFVKSTIILFESPYRIIETLGELQSIYGDIDIVICRELTKVYEEVRREKISESIAHFAKTNPKGEFVILFHL